MISQINTRRFTSIVVLVSSLLVVAGKPIRAQQPFPVLQPDLSQELFATNPLPVGEIDGGIAFAPSGDVWADSCNRQTLFKFAAAIDQSKCIRIERSIGLRVH
jgi:hypothetical protein